MTVPPPPPPPEDNPTGAEDPFGISPSDSSPAPETDFEFEEPGLDSGRPEVAATKSRIIAVGGSVGLLVLFLLYNILFSGKDDKVAETKKLEIVQAPPEPKLSPPPDLPNVGPVAPTSIAPPPSIVPPPIPAPSATNTLPIVDPAKESAAAAQLAERQRSGLFAAGGGSGGLLSPSATTPTSQVLFGSDPNAGFANSASVTQAQKSVATRMGNLRQIIGQGRIIQATLETAISTDLPAQIRAIVSRDTYGEAGDVALIPKGSRLIGTYNTSLIPGQNRVFIIWQRLIRPDGVDIMINSTGVDGLGMAGLAGQLDTKFQQIFSRALMASVITIALASGAEAINGDSETTTSSSPLTGGTSTTTGGTTSAINNSLDRLGQIAQTTLEGFIQLKPTVIVDQGTPVNVMLNRDLVFPADVAGAAIIQ